MSCLNAQLGLAATFNDTHAYITGRTGAKDTRYVGIPWVFSPILGVASVRSCSCLHRVHD